MTAPAVTLDPRYRLLCAAILATAVQEADVLLSPPYSSEEKVFEGVEALVWLYSSASTAYFEAVDVDPDWGREELPLEYHVCIALAVAEYYRPILIKTYMRMGRVIARLKGKVISLADLAKYAEAELDSGIILLRSRNTLPPSTSLPDRLTEIIAAGQSITSSPLRLRS